MYVDYIINILLYIIRNRGKVKVGRFFIYRGLIRVINKIYIRVIIYM